MKRSLLIIGLLFATASAHAQNVLIKNATVHTASTQGTLSNSDVLVQGGIIRAIGKNLANPGNFNTIDAQGKPLTPGLFAGINDIGLEEISLEDSTVDSNLSIKNGASGITEFMRPEFDVFPAYNPRSVLLAIARVGGLSFTALGTDGGLLPGQGAVVRLDGGFDSQVGKRIPFMSIGEGKLNQSGSSRAAQYMLLEQAFHEAKQTTPVENGLLTRVGQQVLNQNMLNDRFFVNVNREADIRYVLKLAQKYQLRIALVGADEAWRVADLLAKNEVPVFIDAMNNLPASFDRLGSTLSNAARLQKAGVSVSFVNGNDSSHNARKIRQIAGNAVANGLPWEAGLAGITSAPAKALGVDAKIGSIEVGKVADLVLWTGDPLEVSSTASAMWLAGKSTPLVSRQTLLRDRYLAPKQNMPRAYQP